MGAGVSIVEHWGSRAIEFANVYLEAADEAYRFS